MEWKSVKSSRTTGLKVKGTFSENEKGKVLQANKHQIIKLTYCPGKVA